MGQSLADRGTVACRRWSGAVLGQRDGGSESLDTMADDRDIITQIDELVDEEHALERAHGDGNSLSKEEKARLRDLEVQLDQLWDLLRQRRARRAAGLDPDEAETRDPSTVEGYRQ